MKLLIFAVLSFFAIVANQAYSQSNIDWGESVLGAQLSISVTNNLIDAGTNTTLQCQIKNSSTNLIAMAQPLMLPDDTHLFLIKSSNKILELTPSRVLGSAITGPAVKAGEIYEWHKSFEIGTNIEAGEYKLEATRYVHSINGTNYQGGKLISNLLEIQLK
jgi:hypothetical protein